MSKYSNEFKLEIVKYYNDGHSYSETMKKFNMIDSSSIKKWVRKYQKHGLQGLIKQVKTSYDGKYKQNVVEYMHSNHLSAAETTIHFNLGNHNVVLRWERIYYEKGPQALYEE